jgi:anaerobic magnesium-protoporphyrin IX monomethyl ester cyclase
VRVVLADLKSTDGFVSKDTVAGGYGSRLRPVSKVAEAMCRIKRRLHDPPSVQMGYLAALAADRGHEVVFTSGAAVDGDIALVLSSLVDYRNETAWADAMRQRGVRVGFVGLAASKMPDLFFSHADFLIAGEPEEAVIRLLDGERVDGIVESAPLDNLDALPFPRWDLVREMKGRMRSAPMTVRPLGGGFPVLASRGCPEFCTYCPHRILAGHRMRSVPNIADELEELCARHARPYIIFRDPLFSEDRDRCFAICDEIGTRGLQLRFECETRLDRLDPTLLYAMQRVGLKAMSFGVESVSADTLRKAGRRPIPQAHQREIMSLCNEFGIATAAFYVFGFLQDTWESIATTIDYSIQLGSTFAQFKILTPYPGTPLWKQMAHLVYERDWQRFDGFTPTFTHPNLTPDQLSFLMRAALARFYVRPSFVTNYLGIDSAWVSRLFDRLDRRVFATQSRREIEATSRAVSC